MATRLTLAGEYQPGRKAWCSGLTGEKLTRGAALPSCTGGLCRAAARAVILAVLAVVLPFLPGTGRAQMPSAVSEAEHAEAAELIGPDPFFGSVTARGAPGQLLRAEVYSGYELPTGVTATRILYVSQTKDSAPTLASAVLLLPAGDPPVGGWPLVLWLHGTTGVAQRCGPSVLRHMGYHATTLAAQNFAVLAPDYVGMSTGGQHMWLSKEQNAADGVYAIRAVRSLREDLSRRWVAVGHSQGGLATWGLAERMHRSPEPGYAGAIAIAPAIGGLQMIADLYAKPENSVFAFYYAHAVKTRFPILDIAKILTPAAIPEFPRIAWQSCIYVGSAVASGLPAPLLQPHWSALPEVRAFDAENRVGDIPVRGPMLIIAAGRDAQVNPKYVDAGARKQCKLSKAVSFGRIDADHDDILDASLAIQTNWIRARLAGEKSNGQCAVKL